MATGRRPSADRAVENPPCAGSSADTEARSSLSGLFSPWVAANPDARGCQGIPKASRPNPLIGRDEHRQLQHHEYREEPPDPHSRQQSRC
jgi:hypothetical protein